MLYERVNVRNKEISNYQKRHQYGLNDKSVSLYPVCNSKSNNFILFASQLKVKYFYFVHQMRCIVQGSIHSTDKLLGNVVSIKQKQKGVNGYNI